MLLTLLFLYVIYLYQKKLKTIKELKESITIINKTNLITSLKLTETRKDLMRFQGENFLLKILLKIKNNE